MEIINNKFRSRYRYTSHCIAVDQSGRKREERDRESIRKSQKAKMTIILGDNMK